MIVKHFNQGWAGVHAASLQDTIVSAMTKKYADDDSKTVLVNNTWYHTRFGPNGEYLGEGPEFHNQITAWLNENKVDNIIIYCFVDPTWEDPSYPDSGAREVRIGYHPRADVWVDFHAMLIARYFKFPTFDLSSEEITKPFMCLNGKPHFHREQIVKCLVARKLHLKGLVSFGGSDSTPVMHLPDEREHQALKGINADPFDAMTLGPQKSWQSHFLNIVTETVSNFESHNFWSEKIFKPIIGLRPFLVYGSAGAVPMLCKYGFEPYVNDFRDISSLDLADPNNIVEFLEVLSHQPVAYLREKYSSLLPKIQHNRAQFDLHVKQQLQLAATPIK